MWLSSKLQPSGNLHSPSLSVDGRLVSVCLHEVSGEPGKGVTLLQGRLKSSLWWVLLTQARSLVRVYVPCVHGNKPLVHAFQDTSLCLWQRL